MKKLILLLLPFMIGCASTVLRKEIDSLNYAKISKKIETAKADGECSITVKSLPRSTAMKLLLDGYDAKAVLETVYYPTEYNFPLEFQETHYLVSWCQ